MCWELLWGARKLVLPDELVVTEQICQMRRVGRSNLLGCFLGESRAEAGEELVWVERV